MKELVSLHKHWISADAVKQVIYSGVTWEKSNHMPDDLIEYARVHSAFARISVMYGLIYVVIEGYRELKLSDVRINKLLSEESYVGMLRRFRNSTFHYQKDPVSQKELEFLDADGSEIWIKELHDAFSDFFDREFKITETMSFLKEDEI